MDKSQANYWQLVWYFSMEGPAQVKLLGATEQQWFIEEDEHNTGANYLMGLCLAYMESMRPSGSIADKLCEAILEVSQHFEPDYWRFESLSKTAEWKRIRVLSRRMLNAEKPMVTPPRRPFHIEALIHVDHYCHASKVRDKKRGKPNRRKD